MHYICLVVKRQQTYLKAFSLFLYYESGQFKMKWEKVMTLTLAIIGLCSCYSGKCEHIKSYSFHGSPEPIVRVS